MLNKICCQKKTTVWLAVILGVVQLFASDMVVAHDSDLIMGVFPRRSFNESVEMFTPLANFLSRELGRSVKLETSHDFPSFWEKVSQSKYDLVHYNQYHYVRSHKQYGYKVLVKNEEFGLSNLSAAIVVRKDSGIQSVDELRQRKILFGGGPKAMQSYIVAKHLLMQAGLSDDDYFSRFAINPPKACIAVYYRQAVAAGTGGKILDLPTIKNAINSDEMRYLAVSPPLAHLPWAVSAKMDHDLAERIKNVLVKLHQSRDGRDVLEKARLTALVQAEDKEYDPHRQIIMEVLGEDYTEN